MLERGPEPKPPRWPWLSYLDSATGAVVGFAAGWMTCALAVFVFLGRCS